MTVRHFTHRAMATTWDIFLRGGDATDAEDAAQSSFREIDQLEAELSRFRPDSDIGRLNRLPAGTTTRVGTAAMDCLLLARDVHAATAGAFDATIGPLHQCWLTPDGSPRRPEKREIDEAAARTGMHHLIIDPENLRLGTRTEGVTVDLGGIGKGYALDQAAARLHALFGFHDFLLNAGDSTVLASGPGPDGIGWPIRAGQSGRLIHLRDESMSGSGTSVKGNHIIDPRTRRPAKVSRRDHVWVRAALASVSDAFSTAFLVLSPADARQVCARHPDIQMVEK